MSEETLDWMLRANAKAKGKRPDYFDDPALDRMLSMLMALVGEVSVMRERLDTVERLLEQKGSLSRGDIESYAPDRDAAFERGCLTREYIARIMRGVQQDIETIRQDEPPVELATVLRDYQFVLTSVNCAHVEGLVGKDEHVYEVVGKPHDLDLIVRAVKEAMRARPTR